MNSPAIKKRILILLCVCGAGLILLSGCGEILKKPQPEPFVGQNAPPPPKEFRWSNGDLPKTFDPAKAVASPETDFVRAMFDGLTDLDAKTLKPIPAIAAQWEASEDFRTWTFRLRQSARWTNGKPIVAKDFVRSWRRVAEMGDKTENFKLFQNIVGTHFSQAPKPQIQSPKPETNANEQRTTNNEQTWFGAEAADEFVLRVWLIEPDKDFPALAAHPAFRPVFDQEAEFENLESAAKIVTSGAFRVISADKTGVALESSKNYWNARAVNLERVRIVPMKDADAALAAYRAGELDAVTNAKFEPLAVKLLASYQDFRSSAFNAVTFYEFNRKRAHLADRRVRQALSLAVDRERLTADELDGAFAPARSLLPHLERGDFRFDAEQARRLLVEAGFKDGKDFPKIKLLISRNDVQRRVARAVAAQWKRHLGIETEIMTGSFEELEQTFDAGDFDLIRRARVLPTTDETANLQLMFETESDINEQLHISPETATNETQPDSTEQTEAPKIGGIEMPRLVPNEKDSNVGFESGRPEIERVKILNEETAIKEFPAIPLFYPMTYALVKPYVKNFETNMLDAPQLKAVEIESNWQR
ncbi:MAG TPA: peptide ABC transporter substrate-binding protein [Pyrinomonadaceae bacterium]